MFVFLFNFGSGPHEEIRMTEPPSSATEGVAQSVICSVSYKCRKNTPTIVWNYSDMQSYISIKKVSIDTSEAQSNLTFIGSLDDDGKTLTCTAKFTAGETSDSGTIHVKSEHRFSPVDKHLFIVGIFHLNRLIMSNILFFRIWKTTWGKRSEWRWVCLSTHAADALCSKVSALILTVLPRGLIVPWQRSTLWLARFLSGSPPWPDPAWSFPAASSSWRTRSWQRASGPNKTEAISTITPRVGCSTISKAEPAFWGQWEKGTVPWR